MINTNTENELTQIKQFLNADDIIKEGGIALKDNELWERVPVEIEWDVSDIASATGDQEFANNLDPEIRIQNRFIKGVNVGVGDGVEAVIAILSLNLPYLGRTSFVLYGHKNAQYLGGLGLNEIENYKTLYFSI